MDITGSRFKKTEKELAEANELLSKEQAKTQALEAEKEKLQSELDAAKIANEEISKENDFLSSRVESLEASFKEFKENQEAKISDEVINNVARMAKFLGEFVEFILKLF